MLKRCVLLGMLGLGLAGAVRLVSVPGQAQSVATSKAYYVAEFELTDPEGIKPYSTGVAATFKPFGGRFIVRGGKLVSRDHRRDRAPSSSSSPAWNGQRLGTIHRNTPR